MFRKWKQTWVGEMQKFGYASMNANVFAFDHFRPSQSFGGQYLCDDLASSDYCPLQTLYGILDLEQPGYFPEPRTAANFNFRPS